MNYVVHRGPGGIKLILDSREIFPDDPGNGTPAMVYCNDCNATYWCVCQEGELIGRDKVYVLTHPQLEWLDKMDIEVDNFMKNNTPSAR